MIYDLGRRPSVFTSPVKNYELNQESKNRSRNAQAKDEENARQVDQLDARLFCGISRHFCEAFVRLWNPR